MNKLTSIINNNFIAILIVAIVSVILGFIMSRTITIWAPPGSSFLFYCLLCFFSFLFLGRFLQKKEEKEEVEKEYRKALPEIRFRQKAQRQRTRENGAYSVAEVSNTQVPFVFNLKTNEKLDPLFLPIVRVNGVAVNVSIAGDFYHLNCYARKAITTTDAELRFSIGISHFTVSNPYLFQKDCQQQKIAWQTEGHPDERKILLPADHFPQVNQNCPLQFVLKIHREPAKNFIGSYNPDENRIVIPLSNAVNKTSCIGKKAKIILPYGKGEEIPLPPPVVMTVNHQAI